MAIELFVSHAHKDARLAAAMVAFLSAGVGLDTKEIRCTSHLATGLASGAAIVDQLRTDIKRCRFFLPLITANSVTSEFVAFEIGAAWMLETNIVPLVYGTSAKRMPYLLRQFLARDISRKEQLIRLAEDLSREIFVASDRPAASTVHDAATAFLYAARTRR